MRLENEERIMQKWIEPIDYNPERHSEPFRRLMEGVGRPKNFPATQTNSVPAPSVTGQPMTQETQATLATTSNEPATGNTANSCTQ